MKKITLFVTMLMMASRVWTVHVPPSLKQLALKQLMLHMTPQNTYQHLSRLPQDVVQTLYGEHSAKPFFIKGLSYGLPIHADLVQTQQSPDGRYLISKDSDTMQIWDLHNLQQGPIKNLPHKGLREWAISPKGQYLISLSAVENTIKIWDFKNLKDEPVQTLKHIRAYMVCTSPDENHLVSVGNDTIEILDLKNLKQDSLQTLQHKDAYRVIVSPDGNHLISGDDKSNVMIWDLKNLHQKTPLLTLSGSKLYAPNTDPFFVTSQGYLVVRISSGFKIFKLDNLQARAARILQHAGIDHNFGKEVMSPDGLYLISTSPSEGTIKVWDLQTLSKEPVVVLQHNRVKVAKVSLDGRYIISSSPDDGTLKIWDYKNLTKSAIQTLDHKWVSSITISRDSRYLVSSSDPQGTIVVWDLHNLGQGPLQQIQVAPKTMHLACPIILVPNKLYFISVDWHVGGSALWWLLPDLFMRPSSDQAIFLIALYQSLASGQKLDLRTIPDLKSIYMNLPDEAQQMISALVIL